MADDMSSGSLDDAPDDGMETVTLGEPAPETPAPPHPVQGPPEVVNLVEFLDEDERNRIAQRVCRDYDADVESSSKHMARMRRWAELYASVMMAKTWPFDRAANVNVPLVTYTVLQIQGRLFDMILPAKGELFHSLPVNQTNDELDRANRTELYLNFLARHEIPGFTQIYDELLFQMAMYGSAFMTYSWNEDEGRIQPECISAQDMVVPYQARSKSPQMHGVPRYTRIRWMTWYDLVEKGASGYFYGTEDIRPVDGTEKDDSEFRQAVDEIAGMEPAGGSTTDEDDERRVLEMHIRWLKLPNAPDKHPALDGKPHAVIAWVDENTSKLLRLVVREEPDPKDKARFDQEMQAQQQARAQVQAFVAANGTHADPMTGQLMPMPPPPPIPPDPAPVKVREVTFFTHYRAFPSEGFYGLGYGDMVGPLNEAVNTIINQSIDRATVNNSRGGFVSRQLRFQRGPILMQPGQFVEVDAPPAAMKDGLQVAPAIPADPDTIKFAQMIESWAQRSAGSGDTLSGEPIGANETARAAMLRNENAQKQISVLGSRVISYMKNDVDMIWRLLSVFLPDQATASVPGKDGQPTSIPVSRSDFIADQRVFPAADPRVTSRQQRVQDANDAWQMAMGNPLMAQNPQILHALTERMLHARDMTDLIPLLAPAQPPPPPPIPQTAENAMFLEGKQPQVNPQDNHDQHLAEIAMFKNSPEFVSMTPQMAEALDQHARNHLAQKMKGAAQNGQPGPGPVPQPPGGGPPGMGGPPGHPPLPGPPPGHAGPPRGPGPLPGGPS
jgi:hypothetical protein